MIMKLKKIAHRGASAYAPENTLAAMQKAVGLGASWVEFDVMLTADQHLVVFHDEYLERVSNGKGRLSDCTNQQLLALDMGSWFSPHFSGEKILSFKKLLDFIQKHPSLSANVELKAYNNDNIKALVEGVYQTCQLAHLSSVQQLLFSSSSIEILKYYRSIDPDCALGLVIDKVTQENLQLAHEVDCISLSVDYTHLLPEHVVWAKKEGYQVLAYTVNDKKLMEKLLKYGVDGIFTDYPDL
jgi:glycerophosphoryl diester phosphodiesterase